VIKLRDVKFLRKNFELKVNFEIKKGEFLGIIGPNGSGKTTLLLLMCNILKPNDGEIFLFDKRIEEYSRLEIGRRIAFLPQRIDFIYDFKVFDTILMGRYPHSVYCNKKEDFEIAEKALKDCGIYHLKDRYLSELSGGELQLTRIARALAQSTQILLLDEPAQNLDINHIIQIFELLKKLNEEGLTIICTSHEINITLNYFKRIILLDEGKIVYDGEPSSEDLARNLRKTFKIKDEFSWVLGVFA